MNDTNSNKFKNPQGALTFRIIAIGFVLYMLGEMLVAYFKGGADAPSLTMVLIGAVVLGGGAVFVGLLTWKAWKAETKKKDEENEETV